MKSTFHGAILALALSVSAAPVARNSTSSTGDHSTPSHSSHGGHSDDDHFGPPMFFGDAGSDDGPPSSKDPGSSPSASRHHHGYHNSTTSSNTTTNPVLSTSTSTPEIVKRNLPSRLITPNVKSFVSKDGHTMFGMQNAVCSDVTLIFARGTTEKGNMGTCIGPELAHALRDEIPSLSVQGVDYPANSKGNTHFGASGGPYMAMLAREARKECPDTKIVLAGYSQGARVIHGALGHVDEPFEGSDVAAVVAFGDPLNGKDELKGVDDDDLLQVCGTKDDRCQKGHVDMKVDGGHISYGQSAKDVAKWIKKTVGK